MFLPQQRIHVVERESSLRYLLNANSQFKNVSLSLPKYPRRKAGDLRFQAG